MSSDTNNTEIIENKKISISLEKSAEEKEDEKTKISAVIRAFIANIGIAAVKFICFLFSSSSAMLSEAIHSGVDSFNSICLMVGIKRGSRPADNEHPFGYGLEANVWAMFASILMLGGTFIAFYSGFDKFFNSHDHSDLLNNYPYMAVALIFTILFESWAVASASRAVLAGRQLLDSL